MSFTYNTKAFAVDRRLPDVTLLKGPTNSLTNTDTLAFKRVMPKPTATFKGVGRPTLKRSKSVVVDAVSGQTAPASLEISGSLPVGMTSAEILTLVEDLAAAMTSPEGDALFTELSIPQS